jgi:hypothetical protein
MRKIDKTCHLSTTYFKWQKELLAGKHPPYDSSNNKYYTDVITLLLHCQKGLCAYTEQYLCQPQCYEDGHWKDGCYKSDKPEFKGQLEHFNPELKKTDAWQWDNFFLADTDVNTKVKGQKKVDSILNTSPRSRARGFDYRGFYLASLPILH